MKKDYSQLPGIRDTQLKSFQSVRPGDTVEIDVEEVEMMQVLDTYDQQVAHIHEAALAAGCWAEIEDYAWTTDVTFNELDSAHKRVIELENSRPINSQMAVTNCILAIEPYLVNEYVALVQSYLNDEIGDFSFNEQRKVIQLRYSVLKIFGEFESLCDN